MDPEPLIALWPLRISVGDNSDMVTTHVAPGVPRGAASRHARHHAAATPAADEAASSE